MSEEEVTAVREQSYRVALELESRNAMQSLWRAAIILLSNITPIAVHWQVLATSAKSAKSANPVGVDQEIEPPQI